MNFNVFFFKSVNFIHAYCLSPDNLAIATGDDSGTIRLWTWKGGISGVFETTGSRLRDIRFSPDGEFLVSVSEDGWVRCWTLSGEATLTRRGTLARWSADGRFLAISPGGYEAVTLWNRRGEWVSAIDPSDYNYSGVRFSPQGAWMSVSSGNNVTVWQF